MDCFNKLCYDEAEGAYGRTEGDYDLTEADYGRTDAFNVMLVEGLDCSKGLLCFLDNRDCLLFRGQ